ncbi:hypothetical protein BGX33_009594 [Mortierella sp. NVP41]|nr:hypothetical protein BGX33_009594 [Mortierella sp. NVP41]
MAIGVALSAVQAGPVDNSNKPSLSNKRVIRSTADASFGKGPKPAPGDVSAAKNIKKDQDLFASCMDEAAIIKAGRKSVADRLQDVVKAFPSTGSSLDKKALSLTIGQLSKLGIQSFVYFVVAADAINPLVNILHLWEGGMGLLAKEFYQDLKMM